MIIKELKKLEKLEFKKQLAFAYLTCERLYPNYVYFSDHFDFGNSCILREAIDTLCLNMFGEKTNKKNIHIFIQEVAENTPDTEDFDSPFVSSALDTCTAVSESLNFLIDHEFTRINHISTYATDSVNMYIQEIEDLDFNQDKGFQQKIDEHPLMKKEIAMQSGIIDFLNYSKTFNFGDLQILLHLQENNKKGNLDL